jgi:hypothetical protein
MKNPNLLSRDQRATSCVKGHNSIAEESGDASLRFYKDVFEACFGPEEAARLRSQANADRAPRVARGSRKRRPI